MGVALLWWWATGGTEDVLRRFLGSFDSSPSAMLSAFEPLRLAADARHTVLLALQSAVKVLLRP